MHVDRYLTDKTRPGKGVRMLENMALVVCFGLFGCCVLGTVLIVMTATQYGAPGWQNFLLLVPALLLTAVMNSITERLRARKHAKVIVEKLQQAGGFVRADEAESLIGVRRAAENAMALVEKGYLTDVRLEQGCLALGEAAALLPQKEEAKQLFRDLEV